ncbi:MAG: alpha-L-rhamnosidase N-terminal domain-containing protein, partial [Lachnospiraceae bacterium]|nr:alpha-L-rhamnosidase N-terminal domain-containing protein [Lachnospiraceae bacterium]
MDIRSSQWITAKVRGDVCPVFRRSFGACGQVVRAYISMTALGIYEAYLNEKRVSDYVLAPGWTSYDHRLQVQEYDVTDLISKENDL